MTREPNGEKASETMQFWGPERDALGWEQHEWSLWIYGPDDILPQPDLLTALANAAAYNVGGCSSMVNGDGKDFPIYAVVLHRGYAWHRAMCSQHHVCCEALDDCDQDHDADPGDCSFCADAPVDLERESARVIQGLS